MLTIQGTLQNTYINPQKISQSTGEIQEAKYYLQIMGEFPHIDGGTKYQLKDVKADLALRDHIEQMINKEIKAPINLFTPKNNQLIYMSIGKGVLPFVVRQNNQTTASPEKQEIEPSENVLLLADYIEEHELSTLQVGIAENDLDIKTSGSEINEAFTLIEQRKQA